jgi:hypothetical protein
MAEAKRERSYSPLLVLVGLILLGMCVAAMVRRQDVLAGGLAVLGLGAMVLAALTPRLAKLSETDDWLVIRKRTYSQPSKTGSAGKAQFHPPVSWTRSQEEGTGRRVPAPTYHAPAYWDT